MRTTPNAPDVTLRGITDADRPFLEALYTSTRREELAQTGWPQPQIDGFLNQQFEAQHNYYMEQFRDADFDLIMGSDGVPIGRLYLEERDDEFRVIDIALLPAWRGKGIGGRIMLGIHDRAFAAGKAVRIHVEQHNPAMRLYHRLGFKKVEDRGIYHLMEALPSSSKRAPEPAA